MSTQLPSLPNEMLSALDDVLSTHKLSESYPYVEPNDNEDKFGFQKLTDAGLDKLALDAHFMNFLDEPENAEMLGHFYDEYHFRGRFDFLTDSGLVIEVTKINDEDLNDTEVVLSYLPQCEYEIEWVVPEKNDDGFGIFETFEDAQAAYERRPEWQLPPRKRYVIWDLPNGEETTTWE